MRFYYSTLFILMLMLLAFVAFPAFSEGNVGFNYSRAVNDVSWGAHGDFEKGFGVAAVDIEGEIQAGDVYTGNIEAGLTFKWLNVGIRLYSNNDITGYALDTLGRRNDIGADLVIPVGGNVDVSVGIFGRNGNPFAPRTALGTLTDTGFSKETFDGLGLENITLDEGLSIEDGSSVNAAVKAEFDVSRFEIEAKGLFELTGTGEKRHQVMTEISTGGTLGGGLNWRVNANVASQFYAGIVEYETKGYAGVESPF